MSGPPGEKWRQSGLSLLQGIGPLVQPPTTLHGSGSLTIEMPKITLFMPSSICSKESAQWYQWP